MADLKTVLTETLREALVSAHPFNGGVYPDWFREWIKEAAPKATDALLGLSGVAVTQLPEPEYGPDGEGQYGFRSPVSSVSVTPGGRVWDEDFDMTADEARDHAACLLAAGVFSEGATND